MAAINIHLSCDLQKPVKVQYLYGVLFSQDNQANVINVAVYNNGEPASISGDVTANIVRSDGGTVAATGGTISGNVCSIVMPAAAYAIPGVISVTVKLTTSGVITSLASFVANVYQSSTDTVVDPGTIIPSVTALISEIETAVASIPSDYSSLWTKLAPAFSSSVNYVAGQYVTYNGGLYRFTTAHSGSWVSGDVVAVNIGGELSDVKSALKLDEEIIFEYGTALPTASTASGWKLDPSTGLCSSDSGFKLEKYEVNEGITLKVVTEGMFQFQNSVSVPSYGTSNRIGITYQGEQLLVVSPTGATYLIISCATSETPSVYPVVNDVKSIADEANNDIHTVFDYDENRLDVASTKDGAIRTTAGTEDTSAVYNSCFYKTVNITSEYVGEKLYISGIAWYTIVPYVFVGQSTAVKYTVVTNPGSTVTQYTDMIFVPDETGTLYINGFTNKQAYASTKTIGDIKKAHLPDEIDVYDVINYEQIEPLTLINDKLLNGSTGAITSSTNDSYKVTDYIDISGKDKVLISSEHFWGQGLYAFYDNDKTFISGYSSASGGTVTVLRNKVVDVPANTKYLVIGFLYQDSFPNPVLFAGTKQKVNTSLEWAGKKWACIGDSLTQSYGVTDIHYFEYISALKGITTVNLGASGNGYAKGENNFMTKGLLVPPDSDVVTIFGSGNDASSGKQLGTASDTGTDTIAGCINTTIDNIYSILPVVNLGIVTPTPWVNNMPYDDGFMESYSNLIVAICKSRSIPCLDLYHESNLNPNSESVRNIAYSKDNGGGVHPNEIGHKMIAAQFKAFLQKLILY